MSEEVSTKLLKMIKDLSQLETNEIELMISIFNKKTKSRVNEYMRKISEDFYIKCEYYGKSQEDLSELREEILWGYEREFARISDRLQEQYVNLVLELQEIQSNQKIALSNYKKMLDIKEEFKNNNEYIAYKKKYNNLNRRIKLAKDKSTIKECKKELEKLKNPIELYETKIDLLVEKYGNYCNLEEECYKKLKECSSSIEEAIDSVMKYDKDWLAVQKKDGIIGKFKKFLMKFVGKKKFETEFINPTKEKISTIRSNTDILIDDIRENTVKYVNTINLYKSQIKHVSNIV